MEPKITNVVVQAVLAAKEEMRQKFWAEHLKIEYNGHVHVVSKEKVVTWCTEHNLDFESYSSWMRYMYEHYSKKPEVQIATW